MSQESTTRNRILVAEDDLISRRMLQGFLSKWGYQVETVADGREALRVLEAETPPPVAILDWMMPGLEGPEVCRRVRQHPDRPYTYLLLLTARTQRDDLLRGLESGADDYLTKPFDAQELRARLRVGERILDLQQGLITAREELRFRATHDALTGIANRGVVLDAIQREHSRQSREGGALGIIMLDLDHFKSINDTYGHLTGDAVLKEAARRITICVRAYDTVGRYGGEEFLVVVPVPDENGVLALAERIRKTIQSEPVHADVAEVRVTASCGVAVSTAEKSFEPPTLLQLADEALYRAKQNGRNRCEIAGRAEPADSSPESRRPEPAKSGSQ